MTPSGFSGLGISPRLLTAIERLRFATPTPIQEKTIPVGIDGKDIIGIAQTGTGKTLAFGIPMIQRLGRDGGQGLVLLPTRELALQVDASIHAVSHGLGLRTAVLIGGDSMHKQLEQLKKNPHILIATPGRLIDHLEQKTLSLGRVRILVLDEADRMLDMGFAPQIRRILDAVPRERQTLLFSATMPAAIVKLSAQYMKMPVRVEIAPSGTAAEGVSHEVFFVHKDQKTLLLAKLLAEYQGTVLVFSRTKFGAKRITRQIKQFGHTSAELHSNRSLSQRREALEGFKKKKYRVLVATDIAARGIDVQGIELVVNYDLPTNPEDYVHRIGRTGRAGMAGRAISFATPEQRRDVRDIERLIRMALPVSRLPELPVMHPSTSTPRPTHHHPASEPQHVPARYARRSSVTLQQPARNDDPFLPIRDLRSGGYRFLSASSPRGQRPVNSAHHAGRRRHDAPRRARRHPFSTRRP